MQRSAFNTIENKLQFRTVDQSQVDGVSLTEDEREYLLPHFLMILVGKPGSGKTTLLKQLLTNPQMYYRKFDDVFVVSPSHAKMGIKVKKENVTPTFSLDWLFQKFTAINEEQLEHVFGTRTNRTIKNKKSIPNNSSLANQVVMNDGKSRFLLSDAFASAIRPSGPPSALNKSKEQPVDKSDEIQRQYDQLKKMPVEKQEQTHRNVLVVLDDVVGSIKKAEFDPRLAQLVMNRRHIIFNGTISIIIVTQKYTLVPARVRSNASWLILYQLNPIDFETAYRDAVTMSRQKWRDLVHFVYGIKLIDEPAKNGRVQTRVQEEEEEKSHKQNSNFDSEEFIDEKNNQQTQKLSDLLKQKKFENLGIWVESNVYFKNFKRINI